MTVLDGPRSGDRQNVPVDEESPAGQDDQHEPVNLGRIAWLVTAGVCLIAAVIILLRRDYGYAGVTFTLALAAAINLF
jgi:hypothetical protein